MTPVGLITIIICLLVGYQLIQRGPAFLAGLAVTATYALYRVMASKANAALRDHAHVAARDPWATPSRAERRLLSKALKLSIAQTALFSQHPRQAMRGAALAERFGIA